ncbi:MAG: hypothetical protein NVSMB65_19710 [Chloroflexota bacterium]
MKEAYLLGCSMGGSIALDVTVESPQRVAALVTVAAGVGFAEPSAVLQAAWDEIEAREKEGDVAGAVELELQLWVDGPRRGPTAVDPHVRARVREMNTAIFERSLGSDGPQPEPLEPPAQHRLAEIAVPVLVIVGDDDVPDAVSAAHLLAAGIPGTRKEVIHGAAHLPNMERPEEFNRIVLDFLASQ